MAQGGFVWNGMAFFDYTTGSPMNTSSGARHETVMRFCEMWGRGCR